MKYGTLCFEVTAFCSKLDKEATFELAHFAYDSEQEIIDHLSTEWELSPDELSALTVEYSFYHSQTGATFDFDDITLDTAIDALDIDDQLFTYAFEEYSDFKDIVTLAQAGASVFTKEELITYLFELYEVPENIQYYIDTERFVTGLGSDFNEKKDGNYINWNK